MKKKFVTITMMLFMVFVFCFTNVMSVNAATKKSATKKWATAYMKVIKKMNKKYNHYFYRLIYFNNDNIPELVVDSLGYSVSMYTYDKHNGKVYTVIDGWGYGAGGNAGYSFLPKKNCLYNLNNDCAGAIQKIYYGKMKNHKMVSRHSEWLTIYNFNDKNKNGVPDFDLGEFNGKSYYYYGNKKISKKKFNSYKISGNYKPLNGSISFEKMKKKLIAKGAK